MKELMRYAPFFIAILGFYAIVFIPEGKRRKQYKNMLNELKVNDEVLTKGGIIGKVITLEEESLVIESGPSRARLKFHRNAVASVLNPKEEITEEKDTK